MGKERVKIFFSENVKSLESAINGFLQTNKGKYVDIRYDSAITNEGWGNSVLLVYETSATSGEEKEQ